MSLPFASADAAEAYDKGERCDMQAGMAKYFASEAAVENSQTAMRIFGGYSYSKEYEIERFYRSSRLTDGLIGLRNAVRTAVIVTMAAWENTQSMGCHYRE